MSREICANGRMTRFLSRALADLEGPGINEETERLFAYHHATKHRYDSVRMNAHSLDWHNQPDPFRTYEGAPLIALPSEPGFPDAGTYATMAAITRVAWPLLVSVTVLAVLVVPTRRFPRGRFVAERFAVGRVWLYFPPKRKTTPAVNRMLFCRLFPPFGNFVKNHSAWNARIANR
jgi:hypothetical protein